MEFTPEQIEFLKGTEGQELLKTNGALPTVDIDSLASTEEGLKSILSNSKVSSELDRRNSKSFENFKTETLSRYVEKTKLDEIETNYKKQLSDVKLETGIEKALMGAKYPELVAGKIDRNKLKLGENGIEGLNEQLEVLKSSYPDLFTTTPTTKPNTPPAPKDNKIVGSKEELENKLKALSSVPKTQTVMAEIMQINRQLNKLKSEG